MNPVPESKQVGIMVVDDSLVVRRVLCEVLSRDPDLKVIAWASNGCTALGKLQTVKPDIILLDVEMPVMTGLEALPEIRKVLPKTPIVMFSSLTEAGAKATLDAIELGATDYVPKPSSADMQGTIENIEHELIPKIKSLCCLPQPKVIPEAEPPAFMTAERTPAKHERLRRVTYVRPEIVAIGVSTGGPEALARLLPAIPATFPLPIVIAQHMPPVFTTMLADRLTKKCALPVRECITGEGLAPGTIWLAPGDNHVIVQVENGRAILRTHQGPKENYCRPSVDVLFQSVAKVYGAKALAIVLTGMGQDGFKGCEALHRAGASILVQDEATSVVWGMPGYVARAGLADKILPLMDIGDEMKFRAGSPLLTALRQ